MNDRRAPPSLHVISGGRDEAPLGPTARDHPALAGHARLLRARSAGREILLSPGRGLALNGTASEIVRLCDGSRSVTSIVNQLAFRHGAPRRAVLEDVLAFLKHLHDRGLVVLG